jgi:hypothetical protein
LSVTPPRNTYLLPNHSSNNHGHHHNNHNSNTNVSHHSSGGGGNNGRGLTTLTNSSSEASSILGKSDEEFESHTSHNFNNNQHINGQNKHTAYNGNNTNGHAISATANKTSLSSMDLNNDTASGATTITLSSTLPAISSNATNGNTNTNNHTPTAMTAPTTTPTTTQTTTSSGNNSISLALYQYDYNIKTAENKFNVNNNGAKNILATSNLFANCNNLYFGGSNGPASYNKMIPSSVAFASTNNTNNYSNSLQKELLLKPSKFNVPGQTPLPASQASALHQQQQSQQQPPPPISSRPEKTKSIVSFTVH